MRNSSLSEKTHNILTACGVVVISVVIFLSVWMERADAANIIYSNQAANYSLYTKSDQDSSTGTLLLTGTTFSPLHYPVYSPDGLSVIYLNSTALWKKSASDFSAGTQIVGTTGLLYKPAFSPDGNYIVYPNHGDGDKLYKKSAFDSNPGSAITSQGAADPNYSPDGTKILYNTLGSATYEKNSSDTLNGSIKIPFASSYGVYSPDGTTIAYRNNSTFGSGYIFEKPSGDTSTGAAENSATSEDISFSPDGKFILYTNDTAGFKLYEKSASDSTNGTQLLSFQSINGSFFPISGVPPGTEAGYGGGVFPLTYNGDKLGCFNNTYFEPSLSTIVDNGFFEGSGTITTDTGANGDFTISDNSGNTDIFSWSNVIYSGSRFDINSLVPSGNVQSNFIYNASSGVPMVLTASLQRKYTAQSFNYVKIGTSVGSSQIISGQSNALVGGQFGFYTGSGYVYTLLYYSGGYLTAYAPTGTIAVGIGQLQLYQTFNFTSFEIGTYGGGLSVLTNCGNGQWSCAIDQSPDSGNLSCTPQYSNGAATGSCGFVNVSGVLRCLPTTPLSSADYTNAYAQPGFSPPTQSGTVVSPSDVPDGSDIFVCNQTGLDVLICPFTVTATIWGKFIGFIRNLANLIYAVSAIASPQGTGNPYGFVFDKAYAEDLGKGIIAPYYHLGYTGAVVPDAAPSYTGIDIVGMNHAMLASGDNTKNLPEGGIKGLFAWTQWALLVISLTAIWAMLFGEI